MIYAKNGVIIEKNNKIFRLFDGKVINKEKIILIFLNLNKLILIKHNLNTNTIVVPKIQELIQLRLLIVLLMFRNSKI